MIHKIGEEVATIEKKTIPALSNISADPLVFYGGSC